MIKKNIYILLIFSFFVFAIFRGYFVGNKVLFPSNLLVSYYQPWASYPWEEYPNGPANKPIGFDNLRIFYPLRHFTTESLKRFELPLWNPYSFSGNVHLAGYQTAVFHPLSFLFLVLPEIDAWSVIIILSPVFSFIFTLLFLKELNLSRKTSLIGALGFAFSGFMMVLWEESFMAFYSAVFLPLVLFAIVNLYKGVTKYNFLVLAVGLTASLLSGWFQMSLYLYVFSYMFAVMLFFFLRKQVKHVGIRSIIFINTGFALSIAVSGLFLFPNIEAFFYSARGSTDAKFIFDTYLQPLWHLSTYLAPDFFGNPGAYNYFGSGFYYEKVIFVSLPILFFAIYGFISKNTVAVERFFRWSFIITLSLGFALPTSWFFLYYLKIPFISVILPSRIFYLATFCLIVLSAFGFEKFLKEKSRKKESITIFILFFGYIILWGFVIFEKFLFPKSEFATISFRNLIFPTLIFIVLSMLVLFLKKYKKIFYFCVLLIVFLSTIYFTDKYLYLSERKFVYPEVPVITRIKELAGSNRFWSYDKAYLERNFATYFNLFSPEGYDSIYIQRYGELISAAQNKGKYSSQIPRTDAVIHGTERLNETLDDFYKKRIIDLLGVKYIIGSNSFDSTKYATDLSAVWNDKKFVIYKNQDAFPRVYITSSYIVEKDNSRIISKLFNKEINLQKTTILEKNPGVKLNPLGKNYSQIITYSPNKVTIKGKSTHGGMLFLSDNYYPGWNAYIDNKKTNIFRANYSFRSIVFPSGEHTVVFSYEPIILKIGLLTTAGGLVALLLLFLKLPKSNYDKL